MRLEIGDRAVFQRAPWLSADTVLKIKSLNLISMHQISREMGVEPLSLRSLWEVSGERVTELESLILRDPSEQSPFFRDEEIEKEFNLYKESGLGLMAFYLKSGVPPHR